MEKDDGVEGAHEFKQTLVVEVWYPDHEERETSSLFARTRRNLIETLDTPCWVCGSKEKREVHHMIIEWAFAGAIDWDKVKAEHPNFDWSSFKEAEDFVDSEYNMRVLCATHHRAKGYGIHALPYPIWVIQKYLRDDFDFDGPNRHVYDDQPNQPLNEDKKD